MAVPSQLSTETAMTGLCCRHDSALIRHSLAYSLPSEPHTTDLCYTHTHTHTLVDLTAQTHAAARSVHDSLTCRLENWAAHQTQRYQTVSDDWLCVCVCVCVHLATNLQLYTDRRSLTSCKMWVSSHNTCRLQSNKHNGQFHKTSEMVHICTLCKLSAK